MAKRSLVTRHARTVHRVLMAWVGQKSLHFRQVQQRKLRTAMTVWPTQSKTPMEHCSIQVPHSQQSCLSMYTSMAMVVGAEISKVRHTLPYSQRPGIRPQDSLKGIHRLPFSRYK